MIEMVEKKQKIKNEIRESFLISILMIIFALVLLFKEEDIINTLVLVVGYIGLAYGALNILFYFRLVESMKKISNHLFKGIVLILFGGIAILKNLMIADILTLVIGAYIIYKNANRFQLCCNFHEKGTNFWKYLAGISLGNVFLGAFIILNPFTATIGISTIIGVCVIVSEGINLIQNIIMLVGMRKDGREKES